MRTFFLAALAAIVVALPASANEPGGAPEAAAAADGASGEAPEGQQEQKAPGAPAPEEDFEYEFEDTDEKGAKRSVKEKLPKSKVSEILARRKRLDAAAFSRLEEANKARDRAQALEGRFTRLKDDPLAWAEMVREAGGDPVQAARAFAEAFMAEQDLTPEQRAAREREQQLTARERRIQEAEQKAAEQEQHQEREQFRQQVTEGIVGALEKSGMPRHPMSMQLIHGHLAAQVRAGAPEDFNRAADDAKDFAKDFTRSWLANLPYEALVRELPPEVIKSIRAGDVARATRGPGARPGQPPPAPRAQQRTEPELKQYLSPDEWRRRKMSGE